MTMSMSDKPNGIEGATKEITQEEYEQIQRQARLARTDTHTLLAGEFATVKSLSTLELQKLLEGRASYQVNNELLQAAQIVFKERLRQGSETELRALRGSTSEFIRDAALREAERRKHPPIDPDDSDTVEV